MVELRSNSNDSGRAGGANVVVADRASIPPNSGAQTVSLAGISAGGGESQTLTVTLSGNTNSTLIPNPAINYTSPNATGVLGYTPAANQSGTATLTVAGGFTNNGLIELTNNTAGYSATLAVTTGPLINAAGATIHSLAPVPGGSRTLAAPLDNQGVVTVDYPLLATGTIEQRNSLTIPVSRTLTVSGLLSLHPGSVTTVDGTLVKNGGCTNLGGTITGSGTGATCP